MINSQEDLKSAIKHLEDWKILVRTLLIMYSQGRFYLEKEIYEKEILFYFAN